MRAPWLLVLLCGCNALSVQPFAGSIVQMSLQGAPVTPVGEHLELWARNGSGDIFRVEGIYRSTGGTAFGLQIRRALDPSDPCMIDGSGNLLTSPGAYQPVRVNGVDQSPDDQVAQVKNRIAQVTATDLGGREAATLLAVVPATATATPQVAVAASATDRLAACTEYWQDPLAYSGNPAQLTAPLHGAVYGFIAYVTLSPPADYDGIRIDTPIDLSDAQEIWLTREQETVDANARGPLFVDSVRTSPLDSGRDVIHFDLTGVGVSGSAALLTRLDQTPVQF